MPTITITDESGQLTIAVDEGEPQPIESVEQACQAVEQVFVGSNEEQTEPVDNMQEDQAEQAFAGGFQGIRGNGING